MVVVLLVGGLGTLGLSACDSKKGKSEGGGQGATGNGPSSPASGAPGTTGTDSGPSSTSTSTPGVGTGGGKLPTFDPTQTVAFQPIPEGVEKPVIDEAVKLGQMLFFDARLSVGGDVACATCHDLTRSGADGQALSTGSKKQKGRRNTPTVLNAAGGFAQGWDARSTTVEDFVVPHATDPTVLGVADAAKLVGTLSSLPVYPAAFKRAYPDESPALSAETVGRALGAYLKKLFARSRWDRYLAGDKAALVQAELDGFAMFVEAGCPSCHQGKWLGATQAQKLGIAKPWPPPAGTDPGRFEVTKQEVDRGMWKVPTLRNVTKTGPWLHDGSLTSLDETIRAMSRHQVGRELGDAQVKAIVTFLETLTGDPPKEVTSRPATLPPAPKSSN